MEAKVLDELIYNEIMRGGARNIPANGCIIMSGRDKQEMTANIYLSFRSTEMETYHCHLGSFKIYYGPKIEDGKPEIYFKYE
jgi:hypothetical protein